MNYKVLIHPRAYVQLEQQYQYIAARNAVAAIHWFELAINSINSLSDFPTRCPVAQVSDQIGREVRQLLIGKRTSVRRVFFIITDDTVHVLSVRHSAQQEAIASDLLSD